MEDSSLVPMELENQHPVNTSLKTRGSKAAGEEVEMNEELKLSDASEESEAEDFVAFVAVLMEM